MALISIKALICGYLEPKKLRARPPNKAATPLSFWLHLGTDQTFQMRYILNISVAKLVPELQGVKLERMKNNPSK